MSSAMPAAFCSAMSITTTSARFLSATPRATVAPTFPAPPTTVTLRFMSAPDSLLLCVLRDLCVVRSLHLLDNRVPEVRRRQLHSAVHLPREVVRDTFGGNGAVHALDNE